MRNRIARAALALSAVALFLGAPSAHAAMIGFSPVSQTVEVGDTLSVAIVVSDLGGEIVSAYDLDVTYDTSILLATDVTFGSLLGDESFFEVFNDFDLSAPGVVDFAQLSLLSDFELMSMQPDSFVLAAIEFQAIGAGTSSLDFVEPLDIVGLGASIIDVDPVSGSVTPIPEPHAALVFAFGALLVGTAIARKRPEPDL
jgi:hypothetical protein